MNGNVFYEENGHKMFGNRFGYAIEYELIRDFFGTARLNFMGRMVMPDDPQHWKKPLQIDLASQCIYELLKQEKNMIVKVYGVYFGFSENSAIEDITETIQKKQLNLLKFDPKISENVQYYLKKCLSEHIINMPIE